MQHWHGLYFKSRRLASWTCAQFSQGGGLTSGVSSAPEHNGTILVLLSAEDIVELNRKAVEVANVQRTEVMVESVVEESVINGEVARRCSVGLERGRLNSSLRTFPRGNGLLWVGENGIGRGRMDVRGKVETIWDQG